MSTVFDPDHRAANHQRRLALEIEDVEGSYHAEIRWRQRTDRDVGPTDAWDEATPIQYPPSREGAIARFHAETNTVLLCGPGGVLRTVLELEHEPRHLQQYVRQQVRE